MTKFESLSKDSAAQREERISEYWEKIDLLHKCVQTREGNKKYIFYEGPPTAIGLAMQGSLQDLASGILIVTLNNFRVGDYVYVGENDNLLKVYSINLFNSLFRNSSNHIVSFPNSYIT